MIPFKELATKALNAAARMRQKVDVQRLNPICVFDVAEHLGVEVKFTNVPSLEGMYRAGSRPTIVLPSREHRPAGRIAFSCAHELGHHAFGHGTRWDEYIEGEKRQPETNPDEWLVNCFAGYLLMPLRAVEHAVEILRIDLRNLAADQVYKLASQFGVGYETVIAHLRWSLRLISDSTAEELSHISLKRIRSGFTGEVDCTHLVFADEHWNGMVAIDLQVGDHAILPTNAAVEGQSVAVVQPVPTGLLVEARLPGRARATVDGTEWATFIRVSRKNYIGRSLFRHWEDPDEQ